MEVISWSRLHTHLIHPICIGAVCLELVIPSDKMVTYVIKLAHVCNYDDNNYFTLDLGVQWYVIP